MTVDSTEIPPERVPPIAEEMASNSKTYAGVLAFVAFVIAIALFGVNAEDVETKGTAESSELVAIVIVGGLMTYVPVHFVIRHARNAARAGRAARLASTDASYAWRLSGKYLIGADAGGIPRTDLTFKINGKLRRMLLAFPRAEVVDKKSG